MTNPKHLFISYASEDMPLARWLAGKLAARGHALWFDKMKHLGGEPWPETIEETIKARTFRTLALVSDASLRKKKPALERMLAQRVVRQQNIPDFLIPLKLDGSETDPLLDMASAISFENGWINGWKTLRKELDAIHAPRSLDNGSALAALNFAPGRDLVNGTGERLFTNLIRVKSFSNVLRVFQAADDMEADEWEALEQAWTFHAITRDMLVALIPQPPEFSDRIRPTREILDCSKPGVFRHNRVQDLAAAVILQALARRLAMAGCSRHPVFKNVFFLSETMAENGHLEYAGFDGKNCRMPIRDKVAFRRLGETEINFHNFAFRLGVVRGADLSWYVQITPAVMFFDARGQAVDDKSALPRLRRLRRTWGNGEWLNRVLAAAHVVTGEPPAGVNDPVFEPGPVRLESPAGLEESILGSGATTARAELPAQEFELDEMEMEEADG